MKKQAPEDLVNALFAEPDPKILTVATLNRSTAHLGLPKPSRIVSEAERELLRQRALGKKHSQKTKEKIGAASLARNAGRTLVERKKANGIKPNFSDAVRAAASARLIALNKSEASRERTRERNLSRKKTGAYFTPEALANIALSNKNRVISDETRKKLATWSGKKHSEETRQKMREVVRPLQPVVICPHCNKSGKASGMKRYHFDNCKQKPN